MGYLPTGAADPELLVIAQERLQLDKEKLRMATRSAWFDGITTAIAIAIPVAALLGLQRYVSFLEKK
jgi:hypothetical protein